MNARTSDSPSTDQQQARMWRRLAQQCREHGDRRMADEAESMARRYEARLRKTPAGDQAA
ncbi:hypothetical protein [Oleiagrimonas sp. C23AA]|uniref:hypothetical protein n=1 Tax=Oleiagrimonas sp. C23AA TaxID=2719047 RepID=UPI001423BD77|nr:hypothetical protein [Oleiagrimonas sp. C23AA]NII09983.1 hypothetical protein [Oleiagrimonas sp. C23AA]